MGKQILKDKRLRNQIRYLVETRQENEFAPSYETDEKFLVEAERDYRSDLEQDNTPHRISFRI